MSDQDNVGRKTDLRAFRPSMDGSLEARLLLTNNHQVFPLPHPGNIQVGFNGSAALLTTASGQSFYLTLAGQGTIRAYNMPGGKFGLILDGTNNLTSLQINPSNDVNGIGVAHTFNYRRAGYTGLINIGAVTVSSGAIGDILGYRTAILSGPLLVGGTQNVDRIAFDMIAPGATINIGGTLNTLDVLNGVQLIGPGTGIVIGQDLNSMTTSGDLDIGGGAGFSVGRDIGHSAQAAKGTGPANIGMTIGGNILIFGGSKLAVGRYSQFPSSSIPQNPIVANTTANITLTTPGAGTGFTSGINVTGSIFGASNILAPTLEFPTTSTAGVVTFTPVPPYSAQGSILP